MLSGDRADAEHATAARWQVVRVAQPGDRSPRQRPPTWCSSRSGDRAGAASWSSARGPHAAARRCKRAAGRAQRGGGRPRGCRPDHRRSRALGTMAAGRRHRPGSSSAVPARRGGAAVAGSAGPATCAHWGRAGGDDLGRAASSARSQQQPSAPTSTNSRDSSLARSPRAWRDPSGTGRPPSRRAPRRVRAA